MRPIATPRLRDVLDSGMEERDPQEGLGADERDADLTRREEALAARMRQADEINAAAERRDDVADARDARSENRERAISLARAREEGFSYDPDAAGVRAAARDREDAKDDRLASQADRHALIEGAPDPEDA